MNRQEAIDFIHQTAQHLERLGEHNPAKALEIALETILPTPDSDTGLVPCGCGEWIYTIEKGSCMDYHVTAKCSECGWDWFSKDGVGNCSAVFGAFITNGDSKRDEAERFLIENAKANNKLNYCPNCGAKMEDKHGH